MMGQWTLIVFMWAGAASFSTSIPGYTTLQNCKKAAPSAMQRIDNARTFSGASISMSYLCIEAY